jgi:putative nucleotidyltransferase with HDIG domain
VNREAALELVREKTEKDTTVRHLISVEGIMRRLGAHFSEDADLWALAGLFHDLDQDQTHDDLARHGHQSAEWLAEAGADPRIANAALAHAHPEYRTDLMSKAIVHADAVAGFLVACALVRPEKANGMKVSSVRKKLKDKAFAPGVARDDIHSVQDPFGPRGNRPRARRLYRPVHRGAPSGSPRDRPLAGLGGGFPPAAGSEQQV